MPFSYSPLWKTMKKNNISTKTKFREIVGITPTTLSKLSKNEYVRMDILDKICCALNCEISEVLTHETYESSIAEIHKENSPSDLKIVSLFSGIGGFELGIKQSNINGDFVFSSEIDKHAQISYEANFQSHNLHGDITKIEEHLIPDHDFLIAGFPCQTFSIAGARKGFEDTRGTLFFDVARIIKEKRPKYLLLENVKNLVNHDNSNTIRVILNTLDSLGYSTDFTIINSSESGVPQSRERTYIVGILNYPTKIFEMDIRSKKIDYLKKELNLSDFKSFNFFNDLRFNNRDLLIEDILETDVDTKYFFNKDGLDDFLHKNDSQIVEKQRKIVKLFDVPKEIINDNERQRRVYSSKGLSPTILARSDSTKIVVNTINGIKLRKFTPIENLRAQGFTEDFIDKLRSINVSDTQLYKQSGNAVSPPVITGIVNHLRNYF